MFPIFEQERVVTYGMIISFVLSLGIRFFLGSLYGHMIRETDNMTTTNNRILKQCKLKFTHCYQLNNGVANIPVFVEKFLTRLSLGPISFSLLYHLSGQLLLLSVIFSGVGVCRSIAAGCMFGQIIPFYICSLIEIYLYFVLNALVDIKQKRESLKINLIDYLENHLANRMQVTREDICMLYGEARPKNRLQRGLELLPIAGWLADRNDEDWKDAQEYETETGETEETSGSAITLDTEEAEALEELLKEFLSMS